jgi:predicted permease
MLLLRELRHALRRLLARPGYAFTAVLTLALGIGANVLVFSLINGVYLAPLPYRDAGELIDVYATQSVSGGAPDSVSIPDYVDLQAGVPAFADSALYADASFNLVEGDTPERLRGLRATPSLFSTLGVSAALGRVFEAGDALPGRDHVAVLSDALWRNRFNADPRILEREVQLDGERYRVIGVMAADFRFPQADAGLFVPFAFAPEQRADDQRGVNYSAIVARLAPGATQAQVEAQAAAVVKRVLERVGSSGPDGAAYARTQRDAGFRFGTRPLREQLSGNNARELLLLQVAVGLVLLIALANAGNLLLTSATSRQAELALRTALGARRADVARPLLAEAIVLAGLGGALGAAGAWFGVKAVANSGLLPAWVHYGIDWRTLAFALAVAAFACAGFGLAPTIFAARTAPQAALRQSSRLSGGGRGAQRVRDGLAIVQVALAVALLAGAGLLLRSFANAAAQSPGFDASQRLTAKLSLPQAKYPDDAARSLAVRRLLDALRAQPGIAAAAITTKLPFGGENGGLFFRIVGGDPSVRTHANLRRVDEDYFAALGIPLLRGRSFNATDWVERAKNVVVDAAFEQRYFPAGNAVGQRITLGQGGNGDAYTIIGVVGTVKHFDLTAPTQKPTYYFNFASMPSDSVHLVLRTRGDAAALADAVRATVRRVDPEQPLFDVTTLEQRIAGSLVGRRVPLQLLSLFAACALGLSALGLYGVLAFGVAQRTAEIGLRMAIGADARRVRRGILGMGARLVGAGALAGILGAVAIGFALRSRLFEVTPVDPASLAAVVAVIALTAFAACWLPAQRAARLDPLVALRHE